MLTVITPAADRTLLTIAELRAAAGVTDTSRDVELTALGGYIAAVIAQACSVTRSGVVPPTLRLETLSEVFRGHQWRAGLAPSRAPVASITSVTEGTTLLGASAYEIDGALLYRLSGSYRCHWHCWPVTVVYTAGWAVVPDDLKYAAMKFVQTALIQGDRDPMLKRKVTVGVSEYEWWVDPTKDKVVPPEVMDILISGGYCNQWSWMR